MTIYTFLLLEAAFAVTAAAAFLLWLVLLIGRYVWLWRRFACACGGEASALAVLRAAEDVGDAAADLELGHAFKMADKYDFLPRTFL